MYLLNFPEDIRWKLKTVGWSMLTYGDMIHDKNLYGPGRTGRCGRHNLESIEPRCRYMHTFLPTHSYQMEHTEPQVVGKH